MHLSVMGGMTDSGPSAFRESGLRVGAACRVGYIRGLRMLWVGSYAAMLAWPRLLVGCCSLGLQVYG